MYLRRIMPWALATWLFVGLIILGINVIRDMKHTKDINKGNAILVDPNTPQVEKIAVVINRSGMFTNCSKVKDGCFYAIYETDKFREVRKFLIFMYGDPPQETIEPVKLEGAEFNRIDLVWEFGNSTLRVSNFEIENGKISPYGFLRFN